MSQPLTYFGGGSISLPLLVISFSTFFTLLSFVGWKNDLEDHKGVRREMTTAPILPLSAPPISDTPSYTNTDRSLLSFSSLKKREVPPH
jgi:hypothetical protein